MPDIARSASAGSFANFESFEPRLAELDEIRSQMEAECAAGALLRLEEAFKSLPASLAAAFLSFQGDCEGGFFGKMLLPTRHGEPAWSNSIMLALDEEGRGQREIFPDEALLIDEFSWVDMEELGAADRAFDDALSFFHRRAPALFYGCMEQSPGQAATCHAGDAIVIGRELGLIQSAALIERSRLGSQCAEPSQRAASRSI